MILLYYIKTQQAASPAPPTPTQEVELCVLFLFFKG